VWNFLPKLLRSEPFDDAHGPLPCWTWINMSERSMSLTFRWAASDRRKPVA